MASDNELNIKRALQTRHLSMIALGGSIGTGLFVTSGSSIAIAGPGSAILAYLCVGIMVYFLMTSLGEMATYLPVSGSFAEYATRYVDPAAGFALGWNYWLNWAITLAVDISTTAIITAYWLPNIPGWIISGFFLCVILALNLISVRAFGETEYWLAMIKVITVLVFIAAGLLSIIGILGGHGPIGLKNFTIGDAPFKGGWSSGLSVFLIAGFSFQGTELIGITAGESETPEKSIPKAVKEVFWRIMIFYVLAIAIIAALIPYTDSHLLGANEASIGMSPFTLVFKRVGLASAASLMNAVILTSVLSSANSGMYASTRMLWAMGRNGLAAKIFGRVNVRGVPVYALIATTAVGALTFITSLFGPHLYQFLVAASGLTGFIAWFGIAVSHYRFRRAFLKQGHDSKELCYKAKLFPIGPIIAGLMGFIIIIGQGAQSLAQQDWQQFLISYLSIPLFFILYIGYKLKHHTHLIPLNEMSLERN